TAVHQDPFPVAFHAVTAAGDRLCRAEKGQFHGAPPCAFSTMIVPRFSSAVKENNVRYDNGSPSAFFCIAPSASCQLFGMTRKLTVFFISFARRRGGGPCSTWYNVLNSHYLLPAVS